MTDHSHPTAGRDLALLIDLAGVGVVLAALYLLFLGGASLFAPAHASRFLLGFAGSAAAHVLELALRLVAGAAFVLYAPRMLFEEAFRVFGWTLLVTTGCMAFLPWQWHRRFAQRVVPTITARFLIVIGLVSLLLASVILFAIVRAGSL